MIHTINGFHNERRRLENGEYLVGWFENDKFDDGFITDVLIQWMTEVANSNANRSIEKLLVAMSNASVFETRDGQYSILMTINDRSPRTDEIVERIGHASRAKALNAMYTLFAPTSHQLSETYFSSIAMYKTFETKFGTHMLVVPDPTHLTSPGMKWEDAVELCHM